ncbi:homoserine O-acetyltransferase/O-succinyltransferase family protein [Lichenicoccus sp.]|uniref:homoserine O-acetyltransferase/O-succinyltransferase family protein n=1 Tax=Lichenicoccus sp. TaxID=2781899 RepID=UPI003D0C48F1
MHRPRPLVVGLVNNMPNGALKSTQEQFTRLLRAACPQREISLELFSCRPSRGQGDGPPSGGAPGALGEYRDLTELYGAHLDAVIVTGMEPQAAHLQDEPAWACLTRLVDWAQETAVPVIWSCLAAHATVFYLDGIRRSRLPAKLSGVFACDLVGVDHPLAEGLPGRWSTPHSRYNGLSEGALVRAGYEILSRAQEAGVDSFLRPGPAPFLFLQGHPEYDARTLLYEYTRDIRRYLLGQRDEYPLVPRNYFAAPLEAALDDYRCHVLAAHRGIAALKEVLQLVANASPANPWDRPAVRLYANWIARLVRGAPDRHPGTFVPGLHGVCHPDPAVLGEC